MNLQDIIYIIKIKKQNKKYKGETTKRIREEKRERKKKPKQREKTPENKQRKNRNRRGQHWLASTPSSTSSPANQVLKGHITLGNACFLNGTNDHALDILARIPLWKDGLDYRHGTGHGIGSYLNVHEGPC